MPLYAVEVAYLERMYDTVTLEADDAQQAEFEAMNSIRDSNLDASNVEVLETKEI